MKHTAEDLYHLAENRLILGECKIVRFPTTRTVVQTLHSSHVWLKLVFGGMVVSTVTSQVPKVHNVPGLNLAWGLSVWSLCGLSKVQRLIDY